MANICQTCLSSDRHLFPVKRLQTLLLRVGLYEITKKEGGLCWECKSKVVNFHKFKQKVRRAQDAISQKIGNPNSLSNLNIEKTFLFDINGKYDEIEPLKFDIDNAPVTVKEEAIRTDIYNEQNHEDFSNAHVDSMYVEVPTTNNNSNLKEEQVLDYNTANVNTEVDTYEENSCNMLDYDAISSNVNKDDMYEENNYEAYLSVQSSSVKGYFTVELKSPGSMEKLKRFEFKNQQLPMEKECLPFKDLLFKCNICNVGFNTEESFDNHMTQIHQVHKDSELHVCKLCEAIFSSKELATEHIMTHNIAKTCNQNNSGVSVSEGSVKFDCRLCNKAFPTNEQLEGHLKIEHSNQCNGCRQIFLDYNSMRMHKVSCVDSYQNACYICGRKFLHEIVLLKHVINHKRGNIEQKPLRKCSECTKLFRTKKALRNHEENHKKKRDQLRNDLYKKYIRVENSSKRALMKQIKPAIELNAEMSYITIGDDTPLEDTENFECNGCQQTFSDKKLLKKHKMKCVKSYENECHRCGKKYLRAGDLRRHLLNHAPEIYQCDDCGKKLKTKSGVYYHMKTHSTKVDKDAYCAECNIQFKNKMIYREHMEHSLKHVSKEQWKYICDECGSRSRTATILKRHIQSVHRYEYNYRCELCPMEFKLNYLLSRHMRKKHAGKEEIKDKICDYCGKAFKEKTTLQEHINIHLGIRPFQCKECELSYTHSGSLYCHMKLRHPDKISTLKKRNPRRKFKKVAQFHNSSWKENPKSCDICGKVCKSKSILEQHMNIHLGLRPYKCKLCDAAFKHSGSLFSHNKTVHLKIKVIRDRNAERERRLKKIAALNLLSPTDKTPVDKQSAN